MRFTRVERDDHIRIGLDHRLQRGVIGVLLVGQALVVELGSPPVASRYVRVAADILLIAIGTGSNIVSMALMGALFGLWH